MKKPTGIQIIKLDDKKTNCKKCGTNLTDVNNITYLEKRWSEPKHWDELSKCDKCGNEFLLRHEIFDPKGHINAYVFTEDINDSNYNWIDNLNNIQKEIIAGHIEKCTACQKRLQEELLSDARLKSIFSSLRKR